VHLLACSSLKPSAARLEVAARHDSSTAAVQQRARPRVLPRETEEQSHKRLSGVGCLWFFIVRQDKVWRPPVEEINPNSDIWVPPDEYGNFDEYSTIAHKYFLCIYYSILLLTCNDILPPDEFKIFFCTFALFLGAIINANIFGNLALIITNLNAKNTEFQHSIDLANTSMYNMNMPSDIQKDVIAYL